MDYLVNGKRYQVIKLLGHGKGGYSYLATNDNHKVVLKKIHHEPCDYYQFGNKIEAEKRDYELLLNAEIRVPKMLDIDIEQEIIIKEYIDSLTIMEMIEKNMDINLYINQVLDMAQKAKKAGLNIDYYPTNFIPFEGLLYYIDYECNNYMDEWSFENWGVNYWKTN